MVDEPGAHSHVLEAIRHLHLAAQSSDCGVCRELYMEEVETLEGIEDLRAHAQEIVARQAEKRAQLSGVPDEPGTGPAPRLLDPAETTTIVSAREHAVEHSGGYEYRREGFIESMIRTRPRVADLIPRLRGERR